MVVLRFTESIHQNKKLVYIFRDKPIVVDQYLNLKYKKPTSSHRFRQIWWETNHDNTQYRDVSPDTTVLYNKRSVAMRDETSPSYSLRSVAMRAPISEPDPACPLSVC